MDYFYSDGEEVIIISSQLASEKSVIFNTWQQFDDPHSYYLPHAIPTILETLKESQLLGTCLDPMTSTRVGLSTVGSTLMVHDKNIYYFNQNSLGINFLFIIIKYLKFNN